jgi:hypothetical protein
VKNWFHQNLLLSNSTCTAYAEAEKQKSNGDAALRSAWAKAAAAAKVGRLYKC